MNLILLLIISHLLCDFVLQSDDIVKQKNQKIISGYINHSLLILIVNFILIIIFYNVTIAFIISFLVTTIHIIIDYLKAKIEIDTPKANFIIFIIDQFSHLIIIYFIGKYSISMFSLTPITHIFKIDMLNLETTLQVILMTIIIYLFVVFAGSVLLELFLNIFDLKLRKNKMKNNISTSKINMGKYIGIIERSLILILVTFGSLSTIGIIFTAKSLARFKEFEEKKFVEYYLLGTLTSIFLALIGGLILKGIIN